LEPWDIIGVPIFIAVSGFFYRRRSHDTASFWKKKGITIVMPWLVAGALRNLVDVFIYHKGETFLYCIQRMLGFTSSFYFPFLLILLFAVFKLVGNRPVLLWVSIAVNVVSLILEELGLNYVSILLGTPSLNVFNWAGFFALGMLARRYRWDRRLIQSRPAGWICVAVFAALYGLTAYGVKEGGTTYYRMDAAIFELSALLALYFLSYQLAGRRQRLLCEIGSCTYCVYLYHLVIVTGLLGLLELPVELTVLMPILGLAVMMGLIEVGKWLCKILKIKWPMTLVGLKG
jgi:peptidoglycan/LPS O-acetylase OafA/YrhL